MEVRSIANVLAPCSDLCATVGALKDDLPEDEEIGEEPLEAQLVEEKPQTSFVCAQSSPPEHNSGGIGGGIGPSSPLEVRSHEDPRMRFTAHNEPSHLTAFSTIEPTIVYAL